MRERMTDAWVDDLAGRRAYGSCADAELLAREVRELRAERRYVEPGDDMPDGWYWCDGLEDDAPPQLLRSYRPMRCNPEDSTFSVDTQSPRIWQRWTIGGWASVTGRICPIRRPQS